MWTWAGFAIGVLGASSALLLPSGPRRWLDFVLGLVAAALWLVVSGLVLRSTRPGPQPGLRPFAAAALAVVVVVCGLVLASAIRRATDPALATLGLRGSAMLAAVSAGLLLVWTVRRRSRRPVAGDGADDRSGSADR
ncbi:hypothetical protein GCM10011594_40180 [Nakamurella endophytica]|uniref:Uncharacterized protein n=1 Tax=Nakamurella endophytica TaxID=1748367 RepID=A0A917WMY5_9ACTN|nr:hypothetical protein GCM10011594_40180 [Nakamurella endophytica]